MALIHFTLATRDVAATKRFFQAVFGWRALEHQSNVPVELEPAWLEIAPGQELHLIKAADFEPSPFEREYGRHIAFSHPRQDLAALSERLMENGAELIEPLRQAPFERVFFRDPNGYVFEVVGSD